MNYIIGIDPGPTESAYVIIQTDSYPGKLLRFGKLSEKVIKEKIIGFFGEHIGNHSVVYPAIEMPASYGMAVGASVFNTCAIVGHFEEFFIGLPSDFTGWQCDPLVGSGPWRVYRKRSSEEGVQAVSMALCKNNRANDSNVRAAIIDLYPSIGGGRIPQIGSKKEPGPLYGVSKDVWAALGVALTFQQFLIEKYSVES